MEVLSGPCVGDVQIIYCNTGRNVPQTGEPAEVPLRMPSCLLPALSGPLWAERHGKGTNTAFKAHVCPWHAAVQCVIFCVMSQELHRDLVLREQWGQGVKTLNENPAEDDILFSFSSDCHCLKPKRHFFLFLPCLSVLFVCFWHVLPNYFFIPFLFFHAFFFPKDQVLYKHCVILPMLPSTDINLLSQQTRSQGEVLLRHDREEQHCCSACSHSERLRAQGWRTLSA